MRPRCNGKPKIAHLRSGAEGRCLCRGTIERDGAWYCHHHDPVRLAAKKKRAAEVFAREQAQRDAQNKFQARCEFVARRLAGPKPDLCVDILSEIRRAVKEYDAAFQAVGEDVEVMLDGQWRPTTVVSAVPNGDRSGYYYRVREPFARRRVLQWPPVLIRRPEESEGGD